MISKMHGQIQEKGGRFFFPMYHPAAALHQEKLRQTLLDDMKKLAEFIRGPLSEPPGKKGERQEQEDPPSQLSLF
jgi:DNA polymerase